MKRIFCALFLLLLLLPLAGCTGKTAPAQEPEATESMATVPASETARPEEASADLPLETQKRVLEANRAQWEFSEPWDSPWFYAYTDLDHNGRLEVIAATTQGSGIFTYANYWEVLPDGSGIDNCYHKGMEIEGPDDWPEIVLDSLSCYFDSAAGCYYYPCEGITHDGYAHQYYAWYALCLKNGVADWEFLAEKSVEWDDNGEHVSCADAQGNDISWLDYDNAAERRFAGMEKSELKLDWTEVEIPWEEEPADPQTES